MKDAEHPSRMPDQPEEPPKPVSKASYLLEQLEDRIKSFQKRRERNRLFAFRLVISGTILSASTTVLLGVTGLSEGVALVLKNIALLTSATVTIISTWEAFFDHKGLWIRYTRTRAQLLAVKTRLQYKLSDTNGAIPDADLDKLFDQYQSILDETNDSWLQLRKDKSPKGA